MSERIALGTAGVLVGAYGAFRLVELGWTNLKATLVWLAAGVALHDGILAPATIAVAAAGMVLLPTRLRGAAAAGLLVLGTVTLTAVPVLGRFGAKEDNPTLLDRNYTAGWLILAATVLVGVVVQGVVAMLSGRPGVLRTGPDAGPGEE